MKQKYFLVAAFVLVLGFLGCTTPASPPSEVAGGAATGALAISFTDQVSSRSLGPSLSMSPASYSLVGNGPGRASFSRTVSASSAAAGITVADLVFGDWTLTASAYNADPSPTLIGAGTATATVKTGETVNASITATQLTGTGTLNLIAGWTGSVENGSISGSLTAETGSASPTSFTISSSGSAYSNSKLEAGYYKLGLQLYDLKQNLISGTEESVRIVSGQSTTGTITFTDVAGPGGSIAMTVTINMKSPILVTIAPDPTNNLNLTATQTGAMATPSFTWYVNGDPSLPTGSVASGSTLSLPHNLDQGYYGIDVLVSVPGGNQAGSGSYVFNNLVVKAASVASLASATAFQAGGLGYDYDMDPPESGAGGAPGFGQSSFNSNVTGLGTRVYTALRIAPQVLLGLSSLSLNDVSSISFWSKQASAATRTWQLKIYTDNPTAAPSNWYLTRINAVITSPATTEWSLNSTSSALNPTSTILFDKITPFGQSDQKPLIPIGFQDVKQGIATTGTNNAPLTIAAHGTESILWIDIAAGDSNKAPVQSGLDGVTITTAKGEIVLDLGD